MRPMLPGFVVALGCSIFAMEAAAQSTYVDTSGGGYVAGSVVTGQVLSQPQAAGTVVGEPVVTGEVVGQPIVTGEIVGQPIVAGGIVGQPVDSGVVVGGPVTYVGTTTIMPAQGPIMPYSYWVTYRRPRGSTSSTAPATSSPSTAAPTAARTIAGRGTTWAAARAGTWRSTITPSCAQPRLIRQS